jgi:hypothetical protein
VNTTTWRVTPAHGGFDWWWLSLAALPLAAAGVLLAARRRRRGTLDAELAEMLRIAQREADPAGRY